MKIITVFKLICNAIKVSREETYYPEFERKSLLIRVFDNIRWVFKYREYNECYNLYGMDIKGAKTISSDYIDFRGFSMLRERANFKDDYSQCAILNDKLLFFRYIKDCEVSQPDVFAVIFEGKILDLNFQPIDIENFRNRKNYFIKIIDGTYGNDIMRINDFEEYDKNREKFSKGRFIIQECITQHHEMSKLNSQCVNSLRLITTMDKNGDVQLFARALRIGTSKTGNVDNFEQGGIAVGITNEGYLKEYGFCLPKYGTKTNMHPDSKMEFKNFKIPFYHQAVEAALRVHKYFYGLHSVGWDIAITENGCVVIEGNGRWGIRGVQTCNGGLKKKWCDSIKEYNH